MTVREFIEWLQQAPQDANVVIRDSDYDEFEIEFFEVSTQAVTREETLRIVI